MNRFNKIIAASVSSPCTSAAHSRGVLCHQHSCYSSISSVSKMTVHMSGVKLITKWMFQDSITTLTLPVQSPNLNPIENLWNKAWEMVKRHVTIKRKLIESPRAAESPMASCPLNLYTMQIHVSDDTYLHPVCKEWLEHADLSAKRKTVFFRPVCVREDL